MIDVRPLLIVTAMLAGCSSGGPPLQELEAVRDYIVAAELEPLEEIRIWRQVSHVVVNEHYAIIEARGGDYLAEFQRRCRNLTRSDWTTQMVDVRTRPNALQARFDTLRGCNFSAFYSITAEQREEILNLGDAPGDEAFMPDEPAAESEN